MKLSRALALAVLAVSVTAGQASAQEKTERHPGKTIYLRTTCIACHGKDGAKAIQDYPNVAGQEKAYMIAQIKDIMDGKRTGSPDATGNPRAAGMRGALIDTEGKPRISDEQIEQVADWLTGLEPAEPKAPEAPVAADRLAEGEKLYQKSKCQTCHGKDGMKPLKGYPFIAGQKKAYVVNQLSDIRSKVRTNGKSKVMLPFVAKLSDADIEMLADYLSQVDRRQARK